MTESPTSAPARPSYPWLMVAVAVLVLALDQLTKWWAVSRLRGSPAIDVVWTLRFRYTENTGAAFSLSPGRGPIIAVLVVAVAVVILWTGRRVDSRLGAVARGLIVGGAFGNLIDRLTRAGSGGFLSGGVVDFIDFQWWPVFNVADSAVVVGALLLVISLVFSPTSGQVDDSPPPEAPAGSGDPGVPDSPAAAPEGT